MAGSIYLDHNATTPVFPEVVEAISSCWNEPALNPSSQHSFGRRARSVLEDARDRVAELLGGDTSGSIPDRVIFTSGGTEANHLAILGTLQTNLANLPPADADNHLIISAIEHPSVMALADRLARTGWNVDRLGVDRTGVTRPDDLRRMLRPETRLVSVMLANNETGVLQPLVEIADICAKYDVPLHTDAAQAAGKLPLSFRELGVASMSVAAHKFGGPIGIGALLLRHGAELSPQMLGGFQQLGYRAGTESVALAVGMRVALEMWHKNRSDWLTRMKTLRDEFERLLAVKGATSPPFPEPCEPVILGAEAERLPNTSNIAFVGLDRQALFLALDQAGVACSTGSACASGSSEPSTVLLAMGCEPRLVTSSLRFSLGATTTEEEIRQAAHRILKVCNNLGRQKGA